MIHQWKGIHEYYNMETQKSAILFAKKVRNWILTCPQSLNHISFVNISSTMYISNWFDASKERSLRVLQHGNPKTWFFFQKKSKIEFWLVLKSWNHLSFVYMSPIMVIDTSMERSSQVLQHVNPKIQFFFQKRSKLNFDLCWSAETTLASPISVLH